MPAAAADRQREVAASCASGVEPSRTQMPDTASSAGVKCSFCGKHQDEVRKLVAGPDVYICDVCIDLCNDVIERECEAEEGPGDPTAQADPLGGAACGSRR